MLQEALHRSIRRRHNNLKRTPTLLLLPLTSASSPGTIGPTCATPASASASAMTASAPSPDGPATAPLSRNPAPASLPSLAGPSAPLALASCTDRCTRAAAEAAVAAPPALSPYATSSG